MTTLRIRINQGPMRSWHTGWFKTKKKKKIHVHMNYISIYVKYVITRNHSILGCLLTFFFFFVFFAPPFSSLFSLALVLEVTRTTCLASHLQLSIYLTRQTFFTQFVPVINSQHRPLFFFFFFPPMRIAYS